MLSEELLERYGYDPVKIAKHEVDERLVNLKIVRPLPNGGTEERNIRELQRFV